MSQTRKVFLILGEENIESYFDSMLTDSQKLQTLLNSVSIYEFDSEIEEEAFRLGICAVNGKNTRDFCEITEANFKALRKRIEGAKPKK